MAKITIAPFKAEKPRVGERYLPEGNAVLCQNARVDRGEVDPLLQPTSNTAVSKVLVLRGQVNEGYDTSTDILSQGDFSDHFVWVTGKGWTIPQTTAIAAAFIDDNGSYTDETTDINDTDSAGDVTLLPATEVVDEDGFIIGHQDKFGEITINSSGATAGLGGAGTWQYWNGSAWANLANVTDETSGFTTAADDQQIYWDIPGDWAVSNINSSVDLYFIRFNVDTVYTQNPTINSASISDGQNRSAKHDGTTVSDLYQDLERNFGTVGRLRQGAPYTVVFTLLDASGSFTVTPKLGGTSGTARTAAGDFSETINAGTSDTYLRFSVTSVAGGGTFTIDNASVKLNISTWAEDATTAANAYVILPFEASDTDDYYNTMKLRVVSGTGAGTNEYTITDYFGAGTAGKFHRCEVTPTWANGTPNSTSVVEIYDDVADEEVNTIYMYDRDGDQEWLTFHNNVSIVRAPVGQDEEERTIWTDGIIPKISYQGLIDVALYTTNSGVTTNFPQDWWHLGVPSPVTKPAVALSGAADDTNESPETRNYVYTFVTAQFEESAPSPVSPDIEWRSGQTVDVSGMDTAPTGRFNVTRKRIYRVNTGITGADFQFVAEIDIAATSFNDDIASIDLAESISSTNYDMPPLDLHSIIEMPNGMLVGLSKNELCFSEPYQPHAWPIEYRQALHDEGVALGAYGSTCVVGTKSEPVIAHGVHPDSISMEKLENPYPCVSATSMVDMGDFVLYAAPDGLVKAQSRDVQLITKNSITAKQWQALTPTAFKAYRWDHMYACFGGATNFLYDPQTDEFITLTADASAGFVNPQTGTLYIFDAAAIRQWEGGTAYTSVWESKVFTFPSKVTFTVGRVDAESYSSVTLKVYRDGSLASTTTVTNDEPFRIDTGALGRYFKVRVETTDVINGVEIATSHREMVNE